nr:aldolase [Anaerolineae bacterium]
LGIRPASIHTLYRARGRGEAGAHWTVPAMNLRSIVYDMARAVFRAALPRQVGAMIFELARSEVGYTSQRPAEYTSAVIAAAIREGYRGPLFIQGDHFQVSAKKYASDPQAESGAVEDLIREAIAAGFYNIDIDTSTLVDLSQPTVTEQQRVNFELCARFTALIRELEPQEVIISVGGEIGEVGGKNSTEEELRAFMDGYNSVLPQGLEGLSKLSIQTGTSHGGVVLPDGTLARVKIDFDTLRRLSAVARNEYGMAGAVQHGASTLPPEAFHKFAEADACEVHLATGFQNIIYEHPLFPDELRQRIYAHIKQAHADQWREGQTEEQFIYKNRKRGFGAFKREFWDLPEEVRAAIGRKLEEQFGFLFEQLGVTSTVGLVEQHVVAPVIHKTPADFGLKGELAMAADLAD